MKGYDNMGMMRLLTRKSDIDNNDNKARAGRLKAVNYSGYDSLEYNDRESLIKAVKRSIWSEYDIVEIWQGKRLIHAGTLKHYLDKNKDIYLYK